MTQGPETPYSYDMRKPVLKDVLAAVRRSTELELSVCFPATVTLVTNGGTLVNVRPDIKKVLATDTGEQEIEPIVIENLPVWSYGQGTEGGGYLQFEVKVGHRGWVHVNDRSLDSWYFGDGSPEKPGGFQTHNPVDGYFKPGARIKSEAQAQDLTGACVLEDSSIKIGAGATQANAAARIQDTVQADVIMLAWMSTVTATLASFGVTISVPTDFGIISSGSGKVMIE